MGRKWETPIKWKRRGFCLCWDFLFGMFDHVKLFPGYAGKFLIKLDRKKIDVK